MSPLPAGGVPGGSGLCADSGSVATVRTARALAPADGPSCVVPSTAMYMVSESHCSCFPVLYINIYKYILFKIIYKSYQNLC